MRRYNRQGTGTRTDKEAHNEQRTGKPRNPDTGEKPRFNAAAFLLDPFHQIYRGGGRQFRRTFLLFLTALFYVCFFSGVGCAAEFRFRHCEQRKMATFSNSVM